MLIYLDTNVYCRPTDDQSKTNIRKETEAFLDIQKLVHKEKIKLLGSDILRYEITKIVNVHKREEANNNLALCDFFVEEHEAILSLAEDLERSCKLGGRDALHIASATLGNAGYFITCDTELIQKMGCVNSVLKKLNREIIINNPLAFLRFFKEVKHV